MDDKRFYVYIYLDPRPEYSGVYRYKNIEFHQEPIWIGKGTKNRYLDKYKERNWNIEKYNDPIHQRIREICSDGYIPIFYKLIENLDKKTAYNLEKFLIHEIGFYNADQFLGESLGLLMNLGPGGYGSSKKAGFNHASLASQTRKHWNYGEKNPFYKRFPQFVERSDRLLNEILLNENLGNYVELTKELIENLGFPTKQSIVRRIKGLIKRENLSFSIEKIKQGRFNKYILIKN